MIYKKLSGNTVETYLEYLKKAMKETPQEMMAEAVDEDGIRQRVNDPFYQKTTSILAIEGQEAVGRIEYHFYGCMQDGYRMAYVDWVYVLPKHRHKGVAQGLLKNLKRNAPPLALTNIIWSGQKRAMQTDFTVHFRMPS